MPACSSRPAARSGWRRMSLPRERLAAELAALAAAPQRLAAMAAAARSLGRLDAADRLADLVLKVAGSLHANAVISVL